MVVAVCAAIEAEIAQLEEAERGEFLAELGLDEPGLNRVIRAAYQAARAAKRISPRGRRKCAPGRCAPARPRPRRPA